MSTISNRTIKLILLFGLIAFFFGMIKNFLISNLFPEQLKSIVLLSSNVSMGVSIILTCLILGVIAFVCTRVISIKGIEISEVQFGVAFNRFIITLILFEGLKILAFIFFQNELNNLSLDDDFSNSIINTKSLLSNKYLDIVSYIIAILVFGISFNPSSLKEFVQTLFLSLLIIILVLVSTIKWFPSSN